MRLYKTIQYDLEMINAIKKGEYPGWFIVAENPVYCDIKEKVK